ncbi:MAG TPA: hypothetical protein VM935_03065 [Chitinophagaceae bacterium]|nr:hypothetical protein [Chitinophagaceae bacterium]
MKPIFVFVLSIYCSLLSAQAIDRKALVERHSVLNKSFDSLASLTVGNGRFAFTVDITGLQTFPKAYEKGVPLGTQSEWGWHSFIDTAGYRLEEAMKEYDLNGRKISYTVQSGTTARAKGATNWFRQNPHRLQLGNLGLVLLHKDGSEAGLNDIKNIRQELNMWTGGIHSNFTFDGIPVTVQTYAHQQEDAVAADVASDLIKEGRLKVRIRFPYPTGEWTDVGTNYNHPQKHSSLILNASAGQALLQHQLDTNRYFVSFNWSGNASLKEGNPHEFILSPGSLTARFSFCTLFRPDAVKKPIAQPTYTPTAANSMKEWRNYWQRGGAIDFSGSTDSRAFEIERRVILSQYLLKTQEAGAFPPQETGLTYNSWFGKPHLEMHWWHSVHWALWGKTDLLQKSLDWYFSAAANAKKIAARQGYEGIRWQKMTDHAGEESPSSVGALLIWQQPHFIYFAELVYRDKQSTEVLHKYKDLLFATADFMASFAHHEKDKDRYILGKGVIPAQERFKAEETFNPTYELAYWHWALSTAQKWRERLKMPREKKWDDVLTKLSRLPVQNGVYLATESATDSYTNPEFKTDHPSVLGTYGMLPVTPLLDKKIMRSTFDLVWNTWTWSDTWGWDFPMTAMTATRLNLPEKAVEGLLMNIRTNTYLRNGHNYQDERLRLYLPGNGGVLSAVALMVAGYDESAATLPGIPKDGRWKVRWEGLKKMP